MKTRVKVGAEVAVAITIALASASAVAQTTPATPPSALPGVFTFAVVGDTVGDADPMQSSAQERQALARIVGSADLAFADLGHALARPGIFRGVRVPEVLGEPARWDSACATFLRDVGIDVVSRANSTAFDFGLDGLIDTARELDVVGISHAGAGINGAAARKPQVVRTQRGQVAVVAATTTFAPMAIAGDVGTLGEARGGVFGIRSQQILLVSEDEMTSVRKVVARQDFEGDQVRDPRQIILGGTQSVGLTVIRVSDQPGQTWEINEKDEAALLDAVRAARDQAGFVVLSLHTEQVQANGAKADFVQPLFHAAIDAGADLVVGHGGHSLGGIEIYRSKPILYDVNSLISSLAAEPNHVNDAPAQTPSSRIAFGVPPHWRDSAAFVAEYRDGNFETLRIYPFSFHTRGSERGLPRIATTAEKRRILRRIGTLTAAYGVRIEEDDGVGWVRANANDDRIAGDEGVAR